MARTPDDFMYLKNKGQRILHQDATKECPECGARVDVDADECPECGYEFEEDDREDAFDPDQARDPKGQFASGGSGGAHAGTEKKWQGGEKGALTHQEHALVTMRGQGASDKAVLEKLGVGMNEAHAIANSAREKLGLQPGASLKDAAKNLGTPKEEKATSSKYGIGDSNKEHDVRVNNKVVSTHPDEKTAIAAAEQTSRENPEAQVSTHPKDSSTGIIRRAPELAVEDNKKWEAAKEDMRKMIAEAKAARPKSGRRAKLH